MHHTNASVEDEDRHIGFDRFADLHHFFKQFRFLFMPTRSIHDDDLEALLLELGNTLSSYSNWICFRIRPKVRDFGLRGGLSGLIKSSSSERVGADNGGFESSLLIMDRKFSTCCGFTIALIRVCEMKVTTSNNAYLETDGH